MNTWMIGQTSMKYHFKKGQSLTVATNTQKRYGYTLK